MAAGALPGMHYNGCSGRQRRPCARFPFPFLFLLCGLAWRLTAGQAMVSPALAIPAEEPWRGSDLQLSALLVKNNNYESLITLCLSLVSLLSISLKGSWNRVITITLPHGTLVLLWKVQDLCACYLLFCLMREDCLFFLVLWCFCQDCLGWGECSSPSALAFHLMLLSQPACAAWGPGTDGFIVTMLSGAEFAVGSDLKSCSAWVLTRVICRETWMPDMHVLGKFGRSCCILSCLQRWITWGWMSDIPSICR